MSNFIKARVVMTIEGRTDWALLNLDPVSEITRSTKRKRQCIVYRAGVTDTGIELDHSLEEIEAMIGMGHK